MLRGVIVMLRQVSLSPLLLRGVLARAYGVSASGLSGRLPVRGARGLLAFALLLVALLVAGTAGAAAPAPMCDQDGASVVAPTEVPMADGGVLEELPCDSVLHFEWLGAALADLLPTADKAIDGSGRGDRAPLGLWVKAVSARALPPARRQALPPQSSWVSPAAAGAPRSGFASGVYRPPLRPAS